LTKAGRKGDATPKAAYIAAYSSMNRGSAVDQTAVMSIKDLLYATALIK
jgi:hypothetical protein